MEPSPQAQSSESSPQDRGKRFFVRNFFAKNLGIFLLGVLAFAVFLGEKAFPQIDEKTDKYFKDVIVEAGTTYAIARAIDSGISVVKESSISVTPFGVGTDLAIGQVLDPVDDAVERLSDILFSAIVSLIIQKSVYEIIGEFAIYGIFVTFVLACGSLIFVRKGKAVRIGVFLKRLCLFLIFARIALPCSVMISSGIEEGYFRPRIEERSDQLGIFIKGVDFELDEKVGNWDKAKKLAQRVPVIVKTYARNAWKIVETSLDLAGLYVALFVVQIILIPLCGLFILVKVANMLFTLDLPVIVRLPGPRKDSLPDVNI